MKLQGGNAWITVSDTRFFDAYEVTVLGDVLLGSSNAKIRALLQQYLSDVIRCDIACL